MTDQKPAADIVEQAKAARVFRDDRMVEMPEKLRDGLVAEITRLRARLEVEPGWSEDADGIACRDDTIKLQDARIATLQRNLDEAVRALTAIDRQVSHRKLRDRPIALTEIRNIVCAALSSIRGEG